MSSSEVSPKVQKGSAIVSTPRSYTETTNALLGWTRALTGVGIFVAPQFIGRLFRIPITAQSALLARGMASRDMALGGVLLAANKSAQEPGGQRELQRALYAGLAIDLLDIGATTYALATGQLGRFGAGMFGSAATGCAMLGIIGLKNLV